jgi:hypothetical protein
MTMPRRSINRHNNAFRQRPRRAAPGAAGAGDGPGVGGGIDARVADAAATTGSGVGVAGIGPPTLGVPHTVQKAVPLSSAVPH